jgi:hypothetical protein
MNEIIQQIKAHARQAQIQPQFAKDQAWEIEQLAEALQARVNVLEEALTPSAATKAAYMSEFSWTEPDFDECGGRTLRQIVVPWTVIKTIMATIRAQAALQETER